MAPTQKPEEPILTNIKALLSVNCEPSQEPRTEIDAITLASVCHCEHPKGLSWAESKGAWQSEPEGRCEAKPRQSARLLRFARNDNCYLCSWERQLP